MLRDTTEHGEPIVVERSGKPMAVIVSFETWNRLIGKENRNEDLEEDLQRHRDRIHAQLGGKKLRDWDTVIDEMREERSAELAYDLLRRERHRAGVARTD
jgi:PHD/YefM family antitoxin component YafN of YafNO toxin-antitoxin module